MMDIGHFGFHRRASIMLGELADADKAKVLDRLKELADKPPSDWPARVLRRADVGTQLYLVRVDNSLRVLIDAPEGGDPEVVDIVRHEVLRQFATAE